jgi:hypothetical protein
MNIFALSTDPVAAAQMVCDVHTSKMSLESAQMMASVLRRYGATDEQFIAYGIVTKAGKPYGNAHPNHPCTLWAGETYGNWLWLAKHARELLNQFYHRYGGQHACHGPIQNMRSLMRLMHSEQGALHWDGFFADRVKTPFVMAMPDEFKRDDGKEVQAYREYYRSKVFKNGKKPSWEKGTTMPHWYVEVDGEYHGQESPSLQRLRWSVLNWGDWDDTIDEHIGQIQTDALAADTEVVEE